MINQVRLAIAAGLISALIALMGLSQPASAPDFIFFNGQVVTMEDEFSIVSAIAIQDDRILAVGSDEVILNLAGPETEQIDLQGRAVLPGFVDAHTHILNNADFWNSNIAENQNLAFRNGITTLANMYSVPEFVAEMEALDAAGELRLRTSLYLTSVTNCGEDLGTWYRDYEQNKSQDDMLRILGVKIFTDGGSCGRPAISFEYADTGGHGDLFHTQEFITERVQDIHDAGFQAAIHAQGDLAIEQALNAIESTINGQPNEQRHRIEHNAYIRNDQLHRYSEIGVMPIIFGAYHTCNGLLSGRYAEVFGEDQLYWLEDWRRFLDANPDLVIAWHGDDPGVPPVSPILELYGYVTRNDIAEDGSVCEAPDWLKAHAITTAEALQLMTMGAAHALFMEDSVGSLKPGKHADLIILSENPLAVDVEEIKDIQFLMTMIGGKVEFCESGSESLCGADGLLTLNIAFGRPVTASRSSQDFPAEWAVDGDATTWWGAEDFPTQWIEIDLGQVRNLSRIRLLTSQSPAGRTIHNIWGRASANATETLLHQFDQTTQDSEWLEIIPPTPWTDIQFIRIETTLSPSWISWREIEIYSDE